MKQKKNLRPRTTLPPGSWPAHAFQSSLASFSLLLTSFSKKNNWPSSAGGSQVAFSRSCLRSRAGNKNSAAFMPHLAPRAGGQVKPQRMGIFWGKPPDQSPRKATTPILFTGDDALFLASPCWLIPDAPGDQQWHLGDRCSLPPTFLNLFAVTWPGHQVC